MSRRAFLLFTDDWLGPGDVREMTAEQRGVYIDLLAYSWDKRGIDPAKLEQPAMLARLTGVSQRKFRAIWEKIQHKFTTDSRGFRVNIRLEEEREYHKLRSEKASNAANTRWSPDANALPDSIADAMPRARVPTQPNPINTISDPSGRASESALELVKPEPPPLDFDAAYALYPRKVGKAKGLKICRAKFKTPADLERLKGAIEAFAAEVRSRGTEEKFIPYFSTFMGGQYQDYLDATPASQPISTLSEADRKYDEERVRKRHELAAADFGMSVEQYLKAGRG